MGRKTREGYAQLREAPDFKIKGKIKGIKILGSRKKMQYVKGLVDF